MNEKIETIYETMEEDEEIKLTNKLSEKIYKTFHDEYMKKYFDKGYDIGKIKYFVLMNFACDLIEDHGWDRQTICEHIVDNIPDNTYVSKTPKTLEQRFNEYMYGNDIT